MGMLGIPLLVVPFAIYNMIAFLTPGVSWSGEVTRVEMMSGGVWTLTAGDILITFSVLLLFVEMLKAARMSRRAMVDHFLSMVLFVVMLIEFLLLRQAATGTFFLLLAIGFVDVVAGFSIAVRTARRDIEIERIEPSA
ncbi:MAG: hypothetical protein HY056_17780 [Proteobacteria bacterium]|nr:hypothetical protein [Pseudomonadota bacterium]